MLYCFFYVLLSLEIMCAAFIVLFLENIKLFLYIMGCLCIYVLKYWLIQTCVKALKQSNVRKAKWRHSRYCLFQINLNILNLTLNYYHFIMSVNRYIILVVISFHFRFQQIFPRLMPECHNKFAYVTF